jgi:L-amino acid N-acyltransferase YncA
MRRDVKDDLTVTIRTASPEDARDVLAIYAPYVMGTAISFEEKPPTPNEMAARIQSSNLWLIAEEDSRISGYAYATKFHPRPAYRWSNEVSIYLVDGARGRGLGRRLLRELLEGLRARGFVNAFAGTTLPNPASVALFESFGFEKVAHQKKVGFKLGAWHDVGWWQLQLRDPPTPPPLIRG